MFYVEITRSKCPVMRGPLSVNISIGAARAVSFVFAPPQLPYAGVMFNHLPKLIHNYCN